MKIFNSIKWRLQLWYGLILVVVLAGFGVTAYQLDRGRQMGRIDQELHRRIGILASALRRPPRGMNANRPFPGPSSREQNQGEPPFTGPPQDAFPNPDDGPLILRRNRPPPEFHLPAEAAGLFGTNTLNNFYYRITMFDAHGSREIAHSDNFQIKEPTVTARLNHYVNQVQQVTGLAASTSLRIQPPIIDLPNDRVTAEMLPSGELIEVGCSIAPELHEMKVIALGLTGFGAVILLLGLAGGWALVGRSLRPVSEISAAAAKISAGDLSQRISATETESELGQLAAVLNSTFARLETAFAQQRQFAADAAHELRTPVSVLLTQVQTALTRERDAAGYRQTVEACQRAAQRMRRLIESLLELTRFDAGQVVLKRMWFDFSKTISDCAELVQPLADERGVKLFFDAGPLEITGDPERLGQVIVNLLTNAIQYNQSGGEVNVKLAAQTGLAVLTVADTGQGIAPEDLPRVFERFYRADASRTGGNAGLGLSICKAIVEAHGGTIEAASESGKGSTFIVRLPV